MEKAARKIGEWSGTLPPAAAVAVKRWVDILSSTSALSQNAFERISSIITNLRNFARLDEVEFQRAQIHDGIESTLALLKGELGSRITVVKELGDLPELDCAPRQLNQLVMNLLLNAIEAIRRAGRDGV